MGTSKPKRVLHLGCGAHIDEDHSVLDIGADINYLFLTALHKASPGLLLVLCDAENLPFKGESMDLTKSEELIEHLEDPGAHISEMARVCSENGEILLRFPNSRVENCIERLHRGFKRFSGHTENFRSEDVIETVKENKLVQDKKFGLYSEWTLYYGVRALLGRIPDIDRSGRNYHVEDRDNLVKFERLIKAARRRSNCVVIKVILAVLDRLIPKSVVLILRKGPAGREGWRESLCHR